jgi:hypothetical protein
MKIYLYCYASPGTYDGERIKQLQTSTIYSAIENGKIDYAYALTPDDIDPLFKEKNKYILNNNRGAGYWLWKYYFANKLLNEDEIKKGDILIYSDSKMLFLNNVKYFIDIIFRDNIDIMTFWKPYMNDTLIFDEKTWTKRDCFILTKTDEEKYTHTMQGWGGFYLYKKSEFSNYFFNEALNYGTDYRIITDSPNECGSPNYNTFKDHRHDQSILSLLSKKYNFYPYRYPTIPSVITKICPIKSYPSIIDDTKSTYPAMLTYAQQ